MKERLSVWENVLCFMQAALLWFVMLALLALGLAEKIVQGLRGKRLIEGPSGAVYAKK